MDSFHFELLSFNRPSDRLLEKENTKFRENRVPPVGSSGTFTEGVVLAESMQDAFELVNLRDHHTWHNVTMREWIDMRVHLVEKRKNNPELQRLWGLYFKARIKAKKRLWKEVGLSRKKEKPPIEGPYLTKLDAILKEIFFSKHDIPDGFTSWEMEFLRRTDWLGTLIEDYQQMPGRSSTTLLLLEWLVTIEDEQNIAEGRAKKREEYAECVSKFHDRKKHRGEIPYLPRPLELLGIYRACLIITENIKRSFHRGITKHNLLDDPKAAQNKIDHWVKTRTGAHCSFLRNFIQHLQTLGYPLYRDEDMILSWKEWEKVLTKPRANITKELLAYMFGSEASTIKRDLAKSTLKKEYDNFHIEEEWREYLDGNTTLFTGVVRERGWYNLVGSGHPNLYCRNTVYFPPSQKT